MCVPVNLGLCLTPHNPVAALGCFWALLVGLGGDGNSRGSVFEGSVRTPTVRVSLQHVPAILLPSSYSCTAVGPRLSLEFSTFDRLSLVEICQLYFSEHTAQTVTDLRTTHDHSRSHNIAANALALAYVDVLGIAAVALAGLRIWIPRSKPVILIPRVELPPLPPSIGVAGKPPLKRWCGWWRKRRRRRERALPTGIGTVWRRSRAPAIPWAASVPG